MLLITTSFGSDFEGLGFDKHPPRSLRIRKRNADHSPTAPIYLYSGPYGLYVRWYSGYSEGPSTQYLSFLVPNTIGSMVFGARSLKYWLFRASGVS